MSSVTPSFLTWSSGVCSLLEMSGSRTRRWRVWPPRHTRSVTLMCYVSAVLIYCITLCVISTTDSRLAPHANTRRTRRAAGPRFEPLSFSSDVFIENRCRCRHLMNPSGTHSAHISLQCLVLGKFISLKGSSDAQVDMVL